MAIRDIITRGFGNGVYSGSIAKIITRGYTIASSLTSKLKTFGVISLVNSAGVGVSSPITSVGLGVLSSLSNSEGLLAIIDSRGVGVSSPIEEDGQGVDSDLC